MILHWDGPKKGTSVRNVETNHSLPFCSAHNYTIRTNPRPTQTAKADILNFQSAANKNANILILDDTNLPEVALAMKDSVELGVITNGVDGLGGVNSRYCDEFSSVRVDNWMKLEPYNCVENQGGVLAVGSYNYHNK